MRCMPLWVLRDALLRRALRVRHPIDGIKKEASSLRNREADASKDAVSITLSQTEILSARTGA